MGGEGTTAKQVLCSVLSEASWRLDFCEVTPDSQVFVEGQMALVSLPVYDLLEQETGVSIKATG